MLSFSEQFIPSDRGNALELLLRMSREMEPHQRFWISVKDGEAVLLTQDDEGTRHLIVWQDDLGDYQLEVGTYAGSVKQLTTGSLAAAQSEEDVSDYWAQLFEEWIWFIHEA